MALPFWGTLSPRISTGNHSSGVSLQWPWPYSTIRHCSGGALCGGPIPAAILSLGPALGHTLKYKYRWREPRPYSSCTLSTCGQVSPWIIASAFQRSSSSHTWAHLSHNWGGQRALHQNAGSRASKSFCLEAMALWTQNRWAATIIFKMSSG